jgi:hypothetical protein
LESVVKSKKYVLPLAVLTPEVTAGLVVAYLTDGRFKAPKDATVEIIPGDPVTTAPAGIPGEPAATPDTRPVPATTETRRPLPPPTIPQ